MDLYPLEIQEELPLTPDDEAIAALENAAYERGFEDGKKDGYSDGRDDGYHAGWEEGKEEGHNEGYWAGFNDGEASVTNACE